MRINGFSKLSKEAKIQWLATQFFQDAEEAAADFRRFWHPDAELQSVLDGFSENTVSNFPMPFGIAPNFLVNGRLYAVPMVIEESSVVAAASMSAKFWLDRGGFKATVLSTRKVGQVHFLWDGNPALLQAHFPAIREVLLEATRELTANMVARGGGVLALELLDQTHLEPHYFQLKAEFETCDSMGANFINSVLEAFARALPQALLSELPEGPCPEVIMSILSNYTPECVVRAEVSCPVPELAACADKLQTEDFARRFALAVRIAEQDPYRAVTHNKGIFNGIDAVVLATANDFRAIEACGHAYAARSGQYRSLSHCSVENGQFRFWIDIPLALGTIGGLTRLHPLAKRALDLLGNPSAQELMEIVAAVGLAQNFAALRSLVTTGIQQGHMKMHLQNILQLLEADDARREQATQYFQNKVISFSAVRDYLDTLNRKPV
jgi:hydroxymethylglutaryl-CoA reductase